MILWVLMFIEFKFYGEKVLGIIYIEFYNCV